MEQVAEEEGGAEDAGWEGAGLQNPPNRRETAQGKGGSSRSSRNVCGPGRGARSCQAGPSLHGTVVGTLGLHPTPTPLPRLSLSAPQTPAGLEPGQR